MKSRNTKLIITTIIIVISFVIILATTTILFVRTNKKAPQATQIQTNQNSSTSPTQDSPSQPAVTTQPKSPASTPPPSQKEPSFTKSSGNNGPIPSGVTVNFICTDDALLKCAIILQNDTTGNKKVLGPIAITDNVRGENFASFYWVSEKGRYTVSAQVTNNQGATSSSINQALEVQ